MSASKRLMTQLSCNQFFRCSCNVLASLAANFPTIFTTSRSSTVASWALIPHGTFNPAFRHSCNGKSVFASCEEIGTRKRSAPLRPMTIAGRTLRLVKSVNGIGRRTTSLREQFIEDIVACVVPCFRQIFFGQFQPGFPLRIRFNGNANTGLFRQRQRLGKHNFPILINSFNSRCHVGKLQSEVRVGKCHRQTCSASNFLSFLRRHGPFHGGFHVHHARFLGANDGRFFLLFRNVAGACGNQNRNRPGGRKIAHGNELH